MSRRMIVTCIRCYSADNVEAEGAPDGTGYLYTCVNTPWNYLAGLGR